MTDDAAAVAETGARTGPSVPRSATAAAFLLPALVLLGALVVYPIIATVAFSFRGPRGGGFVGLANYTELFSNPRITTAIRNNVVWVLVVPAAVTAVGLVFAVLTERVSYGRAFKTVVFMPMAISLLAGGVIWRLVYETDPDRGLLNATVGAVAGVVRPPGPYPGADPSGQVRAVGGELVADVPSSGTVLIPLVGLSDELLPADAQDAAEPAARAGFLTGVVYRDFTPGAQGTRGRLDPGESGLPGVRVELRDRGGGAVAAALTGPAGTFEVPALASGTSIVLPESNFRPAFGGVTWLGSALITPAVIIAYLWIWAGFSMVVIGAGLAAIPREVLEASRVDGASEWQTFRHVTVPLLRPVLGVVLVTLVINVLKIFDIVLVVAPENVQDDANVIALEMWRTAFGARQLGLGSAVAVLLFVLVVPVMALNIRRFRAEAQ